VKKSNGLGSNSRISDSASRACLIICWVGGKKKIKEREGFQVKCTKLNGVFIGRWSG
jgi:hypothetical protein